LAWVVPLSAHAQADAAASAELKAQADALMDASDYPAALAKYKEAYAKLPDPALLYNQGRALELMGRFPEALELLRRFDAQASPELHAKVPNLAQLMTTIEGLTCDLSISITARDQAGPSPNLKNLTIKLGDEVIGSNATTQRRVNARDDATLEVTADGYEPFRATIDLPKGGNVSQPVELLPTDKTATLRIESIPGAVVSVDGALVGQVPTEVRLAPGEHTVLVSLQGYEDNEVKFQLRRGDVRTEYIEPGSAPVYKQWWFWTIGGTLLAGGARPGSPTRTRRNGHRTKARSRLVRRQRWPAPRSTSPAPSLRGLAGGGVGSSLRPREPSKLALSPCFVWSSDTPCPTSTSAP
jgi:hypothetical protein